MKFYALWKAFKDFRRGLFFCHNGVNFLNFKTTVS